MARLPVIDSDTDQWGQLLNDFLLVDHNPDGTNKPGKFSTLSDVPSAGGDAIWSFEGGAYVWHSKSDFVFQDDPRLGGAALQFNIVSASAYTLALTDQGIVVSMIGSGASTITVPSNSSVAFPTGAQVIIRQGPSAGTVSVAGATGVTVESRGSSFSLAGASAWGTLVKVGTNTWDLMGDLA